MKFLKYTNQYGRKANVMLDQIEVIEVNEKTASWSGPLNATKSTIYTKSGSQFAAMETVETLMSRIESEAAND